MGKGYDAKPTPGAKGFDAKPTPGRAGNTGQRSSPSPAGIGLGQHRAVGSGAPGNDRGQRGTLHPGAHVGHYGWDTNGSTENMKVGKSRIDADIATTSQSAGPRIFGEQPGSDDQK